MDSARTVAQASRRCRTKRAGNGRESKTKAGGSRKTTLVGEVLAELTRLGIWAFRAQCGKVRVVRTEGAKPYWMHLAPEGTPDIVGLAPDGSGRLIALECKEGKGRATREQSHTIGSINRQNGVAFVVRSVADVERALKAEGVL